MRTVLHWDVPHTLCQYVKEIGRAGRDGLTAYCNMYVESGWLQKWCEVAHRNVGYVDLKVVQAREVQLYIECRKCRHEYMLQYFGAPDVQRCGGSCDMCSREGQHMVF